MRQVNDFVVIIVVHQILFQGMFFVKNLVLRRRLGIAIKGGNREANVSIGFFAIFISVSIFLALCDPPASSVKWLVPTTAVACCLLVLNLLIAVISLVSLGDSWRVGVLDDQRTALVDVGIYRHSRNPYFLSYLLMFAAYTVLLQSVGLLVLSLVGFAMIHAMVLREEQYLLAVHGVQYSQYQHKVPRYISW
jgi:protein-S-isoprenylcysteine O-methyltransferase Ste14